MPNLKEKLVEYGHKIISAGLVAGAGGNISARDGDIVWVTPSGFAMDDITPGELCGIHLETGAQEVGAQAPTSEMKVHLEVYRVRPDIMAIFHTHSPWASGVITSGVELKPMFAEFVCDLGRTGTVPYLTPSTQDLANVVAEKAREAETIFMVNHGVLALGVTMKEAFYRCAVVEDAAKSLVAAAVVGKPIFLSDEQVAELMALNGAKHRVNMMQKEK